MLERSRNSDRSVIKDRFATMHTAATLISGLGLGIGLTVAAVALFKQSRDQAGNSVDALMLKCKNAADQLDSRIDQTLCQNGISQGGKSRRAS